MEETPLVSIIVPYGPGFSYQTVLESIRAVDYPKDKIEFIVIEGRLPARQRNEGIKAAKGKFLFFFDDDVTVEPSIIRKMLAHYKDPNVAMVGGPNLTPESDTFLQKCFGAVMGSYFATTQMSVRYKALGSAREATEKDIILCNLSARASVLKENLLDERLYPGEENELANRLMAKGYKLMYDPEAVAYHSRRPTLRKFARQNYGYGRGRIESFFVSPKDLQLLFFAPAVFVAYLCALAVLSATKLLPKPIKLFAFSPLILYLILDLVASTAAAIEQKDIRKLAALPFIFPLVHIPYGLGIFGGLIRIYRGIHPPESKLKLEHIGI